MKKLVGVLLIASPFWIILLLTLPGLALFIVRGNSFNSSLLVPLFRFVSFFYFNGVPVAERGFLEREILYSSAGYCLRIILWLIVVLCMACGYRVLRKQEFPFKINWLIFWTALISALIVSSSVGLIMTLFHHTN